LIDRRPASVSAEGMPLAKDLAESVKENGREDEMTEIR